jgi:hypothetical protein
MSMRLIPHHYTSTALSSLTPSRPRSPRAAGSAEGSTDSDTLKADDEYAQPTLGYQHNEYKRLSDDERLKMLGYDATLGRPFGFWSSSGMNICHMSFIYEFVRYVSLYSHEGPLLFVSYR